MRKPPRCAEDQVRHQVTGRHPQCESRERGQSDSSAARSLSKRAPDAAPQQQERHTWCDAHKEPDEKCPAYQEDSSPSICGRSSVGSPQRGHVSLSALRPDGRKTPPTAIASRSPRRRGVIRGTASDHLDVRVASRSVAKERRRGPVRLRCRFRTDAPAWPDCAVRLTWPRCGATVGSDSGHLRGSRHAGPRATFERREAEETKSGLEAVGPDAAPFRH